MFESVKMMYDLPKYSQFEVIKDDLEEWSYVWLLGCFADIPSPRSCC